MPLTLVPKTGPEPLHARLRQLLVRFRRVVVMRNGSQAALLALLLVALFAYLDWRYRLPALVRGLALTGTMVTLALLALRTVIAPWRRERDCLAMARRVERRFPEFNDSLVSAVQFLELPEERQFGSAELRHESIEYATRFADDVDFNEAVASRGWKRSVLALGLAITGAVWLQDRAPAAAEQALVRFFVPFGSDEWPAKTCIEVQSPQSFPHRLARRDWFELRCAIRGVVPERAVVSFWEEGGRPIDQIYPLAKCEQAAGEAILPVKLEPERVERNFRFRVRANDADTGWLDVHVLSPPIFVPRDGRPSPQIHLDFPAYTDLPALDLPDGGSVLEAITGTCVHIRAEADRPVARARFALRTPNARFQAGAFFALFGSRNALDALATLALGREVWTDVPVVLNGDGRLIDIDFIPRVPGAYVLRIEDETGLGSERTFDIRLQTDPSPKVLLLRPGRADVPGLVPRASFDLTALVNDQDFAVRQAFVEFRTAPSEPFRRIDCFDAPTAAAIVPALTALMHPPLRFSAGPFPKLQTYFLDRKQSLSAFTHPDGSPLREGDVLTLRIGANDFDNVTYAKPPGLSEVVDIPIVAPSQIDALLQKWLAQTRNDLLLLHELQQQARQKAADVARALGKAERLTSEQAAQVQQAEQIQQQIGAKLRAAEDGVLPRLARMRQAIADNKLPPSSTTQRIEGASHDLERLANEELGPIEKLLEAARAPNETGPALERAQRRQRDAEETLKSVLDRLEPWSGAGEVRGEARSIAAEMRRQIEALKQIEQGRPSKLAGSQRDDLPEERRSELDRAAVRPEQTAERVRQLLEKLEQLADAKERALKDKNDQNADDLPHLKAEAEALRDALKRADGAALRKQAREAPALIRGNQLGEAQTNLQDAAAQLEKLVKNLEEKQPAEDVDRLQKGAKDAQAKLDQLLEAQEGLQKKVDAAARLADPMQRTDELRKLSREQEKLRQQADELAKQLTRSGNEQTARELRRAARQMEEARGQLEQGQPPAASQEDALDSLDEAKEQLERIQARADEELQREKTTQTAELLKGLRERQAAAINEEKRLQARVLSERKWDVALARGSLPALAEQQQALAKELRDVIAKHFENSAVFGRMLRQSAEAMEAAAKRLHERKDDVLDQLEGIGAFDAGLETRADRAIRQRQDLALRRLDQLLEALQPERDPPPRPQPKKDDPPPKMDDPPKMNPNDATPPLAQLKALRLLQADVAERTAVFDHDHPDRTKLTDDELAELALLQKTQTDIAELVRELAPDGVEP